MGKDVDNGWKIPKISSFLVPLLIAVLLASPYRERLAQAKVTRNGVPLFSVALSINTGLLMEIGNHNFGNKRYNLWTAKAAYKKALDINSNQSFAHYQLARIYFVEGKYEAALAEINEELRLYPENLRSLYVRGLIYGYRGDLAEAEADFARFVTWAPKEWAGYNDLAWVQLKAMRPERARGTLKNAFQIAPEAETNPWLWNSLGVAELNIGNRGAAFIAFETADKLASAMKENEWAAAYPGNNPSERGEGLAAFRETIKKNLETMTRPGP